MSSKSLGLEARLYDYLLAVSVRETPLLGELRRETALLPAAQMQISPEQGQFMAFLVELIGARKALEVGVYTGYSSLCVAQALPADGTLLACDVSEEYTDVARRYWNRAEVTSKIDLRLRPAAETLDELLARNQAGSFDFAFIDADKENYLVYYERIVQLLRPGGLLAVDNVLWGGSVADPDNNEPSTLAIRELNARIHKDERVSITLPPIGDGLFLVRKR